MDTTTATGEDDEGATHGYDAADRGGSGSDSGLETTNGTQIDLFQEADGSVTGRDGGSAGTVVAIRSTAMAR